MHVLSGLVEYRGDTAARRRDDAVDLIGFRRKRIAGNQERAGDPVLRKRSLKGSKRTTAVINIFDREKGEYTR